MRGVGLQAMIFAETKLKDVYVIDLDLSKDERGWFARTFCQEEFRAHKLNPCVAQCSISFNRHKGTLRGLHYQVSPHEEVKTVRCIAGAIFDVIVDLRSGSPTLKQWIAVELTSHNRRMVYVPEGCAHGFQTLTGDTEVFYQMSEFYHPENARGVRWNDPAFRIEWPAGDRLISARDQAFPDFDG